MLDNLPWQWLGSCILVSQWFGSTCGSGDTSFLQPFTYTWPVATRFLLTKRRGDKLWKVEIKKQAIRWKKMDGWNACVLPTSMFNLPNDNCCMQGLLTSGALYESKHASLSGAFPPGDKKRSQLWSQSHYTTLTTEILMAWWRRFKLLDVIYSIYN